MRAYTPLDAMVDVVRGEVNDVMSRIGSELLLILIGRSKLHNIVNHRDGASLDAVFSALANTHRRQVVDLLSLQPASIQQLARHLGISLTTIHRHIQVLQAAGLVRRKKSGRVNFLAINRSTLLLVQEWAGRYQAHWGSDEDTLENYIRGIRDADRRSTDHETKE